MPELKGCNLEEIDQLFDANIPAWKFASYKTTGLSHDVAYFETMAAKKVVDELENAPQAEDVLETSHANSNEKV